MLELVLFVNILKAVPFLKNYFLLFVVEPKLVINYLQTLKSSEELLREQVK
jgi:hypothetical protein